MRSEGQWDTARRAEVRAGAAAAVRVSASAPDGSVLVVEDDPLVRRLIARALTTDGLEVVAVSDSEEALRVMATRSFQLALLDIRLGAMDGIELCRQVVSSYAIPVVFVAASDDIADVVRGLEAGAVDYIKKPFELHELRARVNECLQRTRPAPLTTPVELRDVTIDTDKGEVFKNGRVVHLTMTEFRLFVELARHRGVPLPRPTLLQRVWMSSGETDTRLVDMAIGRLRKKIEDDPRYPQIIRTVRGTGYVIE